MTIEHMSMNTDPVDVAFIFVCVPKCVTVMIHLHRPRVDFATPVERDTDAPGVSNNHVNKP